MPTKTFNVTKDGTGVYAGGSSAWNGGDNHHPIGRWDPGTGLSWVTGAALFAPVSFSGMTRIVSARLFVYMHTDAGWHAHGSGVETVKAYRKKADWSEGGDGENQWGGSNGDNIVDANLASFNSGDDGNLDNDAADEALRSVVITGIVEEWFNGQANFGLILKAASTDSNDAVEIYSRESGSSTKPYIEIEYEDNTAPNAPTDESPTGLAVSATGRLHLKHSDPDSGDDAQKAQFRLYPADESEVIGNNLGLAGAVDNGVDCSWGASPLVSGREFAWRGRTYDGDEWGPFSPYHHFYYEPTQPAPALTYPAAGAELADRTPTLQATHNLLGDSDMDNAEFEVDEWDGSEWITAWDSGTFIENGVNVDEPVPSGILDWGGQYRYRCRVKTTLGTWSEWSAYREFTTQAAGSPQNISPSGIKTTDLTPLISFDAADGQTVATWEYEVYEAGSGTVHGSESGIAGGSAASVSKAYASTALSPGNYEVRVRYTADVGGTSPWSSRQPFAINSAPSAPSLVAPENGDYVETLTPTFDWQFEDSDKENWGDEQAAYTLEVRNNATDALIDTLVGTTATSRVYDGAALAFDTTYKWRVKCDDGSGYGPYSSYRTFTPSQPPVAGTPAPAAADLDAEGDINGPTPTWEWTYSSPGAYVQHSYRLEIERSTDGSPVIDTGIVISDTTSHVVPSGLLVNGESYLARVTVTDENGLSTTSADSAAYLTDFAPPAELAGLATTADPSTSKIVLEWEASSDPNFDHYEVWRRRYGETEWTVLADNITDIGETSYSDYAIGLNVTYEYAVLQVADISGDIVQGLYSPTTSALSGVAAWYLVAPDREDLTVELRWAEGVDEGIPVQQQKFDALGRKFKVVIEGQVLGTEGMLILHVEYDDRSVLAAVEALLRAQLDKVLVKAPTGEVYPSKLGSLRKRRLRRGATELSIEYTQIEAP